MSQEPCERREDHGEGRRRRCTLGIDPEPDESGHDDVPAADAEQAADEPRDGAHRDPGADGAWGRRHVARLRRGEEHHCGCEEAERDEQADVGPAPESLAHQTPSGDGTELTRKRILVVEDDQDTRDVLVYTLEREGFDVSAAPDGERGLEAMRARRPDLVLLDLLMPRLGGREVLSAMRRDPALSAIPVISVSASPAETRPAAVLAHIPKPFGIRELVEAVTLALGR